MSSPLRIRPAVRALVVDPDGRVLLVRFEFPTATVWCPPGGGVEPDEDPIAALERELAEELGLVGATIGPHVWNRRHLIRFDHGGSWDGQHEQIHLVRTEHFEPSPQLSWEELRAERIHELRWWSLAEIAAHPGRFVPTELSRHLAALLRDGPPATPIDTSDPTPSGN